MTEVLPTTSHLLKVLLDLSSAISGIKPPTHKKSHPNHGKEETVAPVAVWGTILYSSLLRSQLGSGHHW